MKSAKLVLDISAMQESFFDDAALIGIAAGYPVHRFCWLLNMRFNLSFSRAYEMDVCLRSKKEEDHQYFPVYQYSEPLNGAAHLFYKLRSGKSHLLPEIKNVDYLWMVQSLQSSEYAALYTAYMRTMPEVQLAMLLLPEELKSRGNLLV